MAKPTLNPVFTGFSRSIGGITFYNHHGETLSRRKGVPTGKPTALQERVKECFCLAVSDWKLLPEVVRESWKKAAKYRLGYNRFIGVNSLRHRNDNPIQISEELGIAGFVPFRGCGGFGRYQSVVRDSRRDTQHDAGSLLPPGKKRKD